MSKWVPREEYAKNLTEDQLRDFYIKSDPRKKAPAKKSYSRSKAGTVTYPASVKGRGAYSTETGKERRDTYLMHRRMLHLLQIMVLD